ncbi:MAG TPA: hypothetical protein VGK01_18355 [Candidatus Angelobacter sp.]|jgi:hypothetical protein
MAWGMKREGLVAEWFLAFKCFNGTAGREFVVLVKGGCDNFWKQLRDRWQTMRSPSVPIVSWLPQNELTTISNIPDVEPISAFLEKRRTNDFKSRRSRIHTRN